MDVWYAIFNALQDIDHWETLHSKLKHLSAMQRKHPNVTDEDDLPKDYAAAFRVLY